jgi:hypothetical protein
MSTRREFLSTCSALTAAAALTPAGLLAAPAPGRLAHPSSLDYGGFRQHLGSVFRVRAQSGQTQGLTLVEVERPERRQPGVPPAPGASCDTFALVFRGARALGLEQDTYWFDHRAMGRFEMFIVPVEQADPNHCYYQAIFNRLIPEPLPPWEGQRPAHRRHEPFY